MVALMRPRAAGGCEWTYVSKWKQLSRYRKWNIAIGRWATDLNTFGVRPVIELRDGEHYLRVERFAESLATYPDGVSRQWQRRLDAETPLRPSLIGEVRKFTTQGPPCPSQEKSEC